MLTGLICTYVSSHPIVLMHGILSNHNELLAARDWFSSHTASPVHAIEIGNGILDSLRPMSWQVQQLCATIKAYPELAEGFHFVGISQGGLLGRCYVEYCTDGPPVYTLLTMGTPHAGVFLLPSFPKIYSEFHQSTLSYAGYWKDPYQYDNYLQNSTFLPALNGEHKYIPKRLLMLKNLVLVWSEGDNVITPVSLNFTNPVLWRSCLSTNHHNI